MLANRWDCFATKSALNAASTPRGRSNQHAANDEGVNVCRPQGGNGSRVPMRFRAQGCATEPLREPPHSSVVLTFFEALDACCAVRCMSSTARPRTAAKLHAARRAVNVACYILHAVRCTVRAARCTARVCARPRAAAARARCPPTTCRARASSQWSTPVHVGRRTLDVTAMRCARRARRAHDRPQRPNGRSSPVPQHGGCWLSAAQKALAGCSTTKPVLKGERCRAARERQRAAWVCGDACSAQVCFARRSAILHT